MKTGLVLEGGALRTIYSSGVTDGLLEGNIDFDYVVGVSAGIAYGVSFLSRQFGRNLEILMRYATDKRYMGARNLLKPGNLQLLWPGFRLSRDSQRVGAL